MIKFLRSLFQKTVSKVITPAEPQWARPEGNTWVDLTQEQVIFINTTGTCPYCKTSVYGGPSGGASQNLYCGNIECNTALNVSEMIPWGQFIGGVPKNFRDFLERQIVSPDTEE